MGILLSCQNISKTFGSHAIFDGVSLGLCDGDRAGMIGPNGSGKSTFLKILAGLEIADHGEITRRNSLKVGYVAQKEAFDSDASVAAVLSQALQNQGLDEYALDSEVNQVLGKIGLADPTQKAKSLSGGWQKRLAITQALVQNPDLILMDEPTNHLDLEGILWLEKLLRTTTCAYLVVSHDRRFLENVATRLMEFNASYPDGYFSSSGTYEDFLVNRDDFLAGQKRQEEALAGRVRREEDWLRHGPKARTTKAKSRIKEAHALIGELGELKSRNALSSRTADIDFTASGRKTKRLAHWEGVSKNFGDKRVLENLTLTLNAGTKIGLAGFNGSGKSTILKLIAGEIQPDSGLIQAAPGLKIVTFSQNRGELDLKQTLKQALASSGDQVVYRGRSLHVSSWARRFLFRTDSLEMPVGKLSGGEQARLLIARLMLEPADILLLDEPTNDLDIPTLEILEESLDDFAGAVVLVTHDRYMLDRVSEMVLGLDGQGSATFYADYGQWETAMQKQNSQKSAAKKNDKPATIPSAPKKSGRLSYNEQREWDQMEGKILAAEGDLAKAQNDMADPAGVLDPKKLAACCEALKSAQERVETLYARWAELEEMRRK